jgi:hypothetical protein
MLNIERDRVTGPLTEKTRQKTYITRKHVTGGFLFSVKERRRGPRIPVSGHLVPGQSPPGSQAVKVGKKRWLLYANSKSSLCAWI